MKKSTDELLKILQNKKDFNSFVNENDEEFLSMPLCELLEKFLTESGKTRADVVKKSNVEKTYCYQVFSGLKKNPSRDKLIMICIGMELDLKKTQVLLKSAGYPQLYPRIKRDSAIIFSIENRLSIIDTNELLFDISEDILE